MIKLLTAILSVILIVIAGCSSRPKSRQQEEGKGVLVFEEEMHNFGAVTYGDVVGVSFKCRNQGQGAVSINKVVLGCGCTEANYSKMPLAPGDSMYLEVVFDSKGLNGRQVKKITVLANDSLKVHDLYIWADVKQ